MDNKRLLIVSTSTIHGSGYLEYIKPTIQSFFGTIKKIVFVPFARPSGITHDDYTAKAQEVFSSLGYEVKGAHTFSSAQEATDWAEGFFTGGGNTYVLLDELYKRGYLPLLRESIADGKPYMGTSAGSNITGQTICTTNDMPIVYPPSFDALKLVPFNLNPHYLDPDVNSKHMGETRETRIKEFHIYNELPVVGLREGSSLRIENNSIQLLGEHPARIFRKNQEAIELTNTDDFSFLMD